MVHNNYNAMLCKRSKTNSKTSTKTIGANFQLGRVIIVAAALIVMLNRRVILVSAALIVMLNRRVILVAAALIVMLSSL